MSSGASWRRSSMSWREVKRALDRIWRLVETTNLEMVDAADRIREHKQRKQQLEQDGG